MSAGDAVIKGWQGGSATYREGEYEISYEPSVAADNIHMTAKATRKIRCFTKDVQSIIASLALTVYGLPVKSITAAGAVQTETLSGYWTLQNVDVSSRGIMSEIRAVYSGQVIFSLVFDLPAGVTLTAATGKVTLAYNGHTIQEWDSGTGVTTKGFDVVCKLETTRLERVRANDVYQPSIGNTYTAPMPVLFLLCDGVVMETIRFPQNSWPSTQVTFWHQYTIFYETEPTSEQRAEAAAAVLERWQALRSAGLTAINPKTADDVAVITTPPRTAY